MATSLTDIVQVQQTASCYGSAAVVMATFVSVAGVGVVNYVIH